MTVIEKDKDDKMPRKASEHNSKSEWLQNIVTHHYLLVVKSFYDINESDHGRL